MCVDSLLTRCYLQVSGSVRVRRGVVGRLGLGIGLGVGLGLGLALGLQLGIRIGFRRNHSQTINSTRCYNRIRQTVPCLDNCIRKEIFT